VHTERWRGREGDNILRGLNFVGRLWYYFRTGYGTYLTFVLGVVNTLTVIYYLLIKSVPALLVIFPAFLEFSLVAVLTVVPLAVFTGWLHIKGSPAWYAEQDVIVEASPYNYKLPPGFYREAWTPTYLELLELTRRLAKRENLLTVEEEAKIQELEKKLNILVEGGYVGNPRRRSMT